MWNNAWIVGTSNYIPIYSGKDGCLRHWVSWNRGGMATQFALPPPSSDVPGNNSIDITPKEDDDSTI